MTDVPERLAKALSDRYRIVRRLGEGGMATVYLADDPKHDRNVAQGSEAGVGRSRTLRWAALVHDFGITAVPNSIWDKPGSLTRAEFDRVELHPMLTEQMLRRSPAPGLLNAAN